MYKFTKCYLVVTEVRDGDERYNDTFVMETTDDLFKADGIMEIRCEDILHWQYGTVRYDGNINQYTDGGCRVISVKTIADIPQDDYLVLSKYLPVFDMDEYLMDCDFEEEHG